MTVLDRVLGESDGDALVAELELPAVVVWGTRLLAVLTAVVALVGSHFVDGPIRPPLVLLLAAMLLPWFVETATGRFLPDGLFAVMVLTPPVVEVFVRILDLGTGAWARNDDLSFGSSASVYLVMTMLISLAFSPRRYLVLAGAAALVIYGVRAGLLEDGIYSAVSWAIALVFTLAAAVGVRVGALQVARAQRANVQRDAVDRRRQIARDVHDVVAHTLAVTMLHVTAARMALLRADTTDATEALEEAERNGRASLADVRRIIRILRSENDTAVDAAQPTMTEVPALIAHYRSAGLAVRGAVTGPLDSVSATVGLTVYRVVQEALANAARHGDGTATVDVLVAGDGVVLEVRNPVRASAVATDGSGVRGMRERVESLGGRIVVGPDSGDEWRVRVELAQDPVVTPARMEARGR